MGSVSILIKTNKDHTQFKKSSQKQEVMMRIMELVREQMSGADAGGAMYVQTSATNPVAASGTLTLTYGSISGSDTCVIAGSTLTCVTGTPSTNEFKKETNATVTAANLVTLINAHATLSKYVTASSALGVVTLTANQKGSWGNLITVVGSTGMVASAATLASGAGGPEGAGVQVR